jgi:hypothetical protein
MIEVAIVYFSVAFGFYSGALVASLIRGEDYRNASVISLIRGFVGALFWPIFIGMIMYYGTKGIIDEYR